MSSLSREASENQFAPSMTVTITAFNPTSAEAFGRAFVTMPPGDDASFAEAILRSLREHGLYGEDGTRSERLASHHHLEGIAERFGHPIWK